MAITDLITVIIVSLATNGYFYALDGILYPLKLLIEKLSKAHTGEPEYKPKWYSHLMIPIVICPVCFSFWAYLILSFSVSPYDVLSNILGAFACAGLTELINKIKDKE